MRKLLLFINCLLIILFANAQQNDSIMIKKIVDETMTNGTAYENLRVLCKQVGARLSGSPQYMKAVTLTSKMMKEAGADTVYLQPCMVPHWVRGEKEVGHATLSNGFKYDFHLAALGNSVGTGIKGINGKIVEVRTMAELDQLGEAGVKGKIVFFNFQMNPTYIQTFRAYGESGVSRTRGPSKAAKYGATGAIVRSLGINPNNDPHTGVTVYDKLYPKIPAVAISTNDANFLSNELKRGNVMDVYFRTTSEMLVDEKAYNVIGEIRGSQFPNEYITVGGHLDSWDLAEGANDDGSGDVQSMEVLRTLHANGIRPKRTIRAVLFANEENGGRGAEAYLNAAKLNKEKHVFALESDNGGFTPRGFSLEMSAEQQRSISKWKDLFYPYGVYFFTPGGSGSDVGPLKELGTALAEISVDTQRYFDIHHTPTDVFENVSRRELLLGAANMAGLIWLVSEYGL